MILSDKNSDESEITSVYAAGAEDVDLAVRAARKALKDPSWKDLPPTERGYLMNKLADLVEQHKEILATIETWDNGIISLLIMVLPQDTYTLSRKAIFRRSE